ncbi:unnamed protein product [Camellia sinensis]
MISELVRIVTKHDNCSSTYMGTCKRWDIASHTTLKPRKLFTDWYICCRKDGQDTKEELQKRNLRDELEKRERRHFSSKDKSYIDDRDRRKGGHLLLEGARRDAEDRLIPRSVDANDADVEHKSGDGSDDDDDEDDADDTEALLLELEQIKKERAEEKLRNKKSLRSKKQNWWDDDVVFKNQARGESKAPKRFINDTIRNDFHRKFLHKYMK